MSDLWNAVWVSASFFAAWFGARHGAKSRRRFKMRRQDNCVDCDRSISNDTRSSCHPTRCVWCASKVPMRERDE